MKAPRILIDGRDLGSNGNVWLRGVGKVGVTGKRRQVWKVGGARYMGAGQSAKPSIA